MTTSTLGATLAAKASLDAAGIPVPLDTWMRFWDHVEPTFRGAACWIWTGATRAGYGAFKLDGDVHGAHRLIAGWVRGGLDAGDVVDHLCGTRLCVRPAHLDVTTHGDNIRRGSDPHFRLAGTTS